MSHRRNGAKQTTTFTERLLKAAAEARAIGRFEVLTETALPITEAANDLLTSRNSDRDA